MDKGKIEQAGFKPPAVIHVDLDGGESIYEAHGWKYPLKHDPLFESGLGNLLDFLEKAALKATLFVIAKDLHDSRKCELVKEAVVRGHEIGSHSLTHRKMTALSYDDKKREIFESRELLCQKLGVEISGFRAPGFYLDRTVLELLADAGYTYDSSVFPNDKFSRMLEVSSITSLPHRPVFNSPLVELPLPEYSPLPVPFHICYSLVLGQWYFRVGLWRFRRTHAPMVLLFHLTDLAAPIPKDALPGWKASLYTLSFLSSERKRQLCENMLSLVRRHYRFVDTNTLISSSFK